MITRSSTARAALAVAVVIAGSVPGVPRLTRADDVTVPIALQIELLTRVVRFERTYSAERGRTRSHVLIVVQRGDVGSARAAAQVRANLDRLRVLGGRPVTMSEHTFTDAAALVRDAEAQSAAVVYLTPGLTPHMGAIADAMAERPLLTVAASKVDIGRGPVVGFELVSSRPRIVIDVGRARRHGLEFNALLLQIARVIR